jgi:signal transduction histidine kinase
MLHEFITLYRDAIVARARAKVTSRPWPPASAVELENGVPLFLTQLSETLRLGLSETPFAADAIGTSAARHGGELLALGYNVSQVVHGYGDICQAVTELAMEQKAPVTTEEFHTLNRCLDNAIAEAVTEHARITAQGVTEDARVTARDVTENARRTELRRSSDETVRLGQLTHEIRNLLNTALLAFHTLKRGDVGVNGHTAAVLGRNLMGLRELVDRQFADIRVAARERRRERLAVTSFFNEIALAGSLHAEYRQQQFVTEPVEPELEVNADTQLLGSAVMNLLTNAFKYSRAGGRVILRAHKRGKRLLIEVEDQCGGIPDTAGDPFRAFGDQRGDDQTGLGLGLSIARKAVKAHGGDITIRNMPGKGCVFVIEVPLAVEDAIAAPAIT